MFEKFTEKAVDVVKSAQITAIELNHQKIYAEHLLVALANQKASLVTKMLSMAKLTSNELKIIVKSKLKEREASHPTEYVVFSDNLKNIFERSIYVAHKLGNRYIQPEHLFLSLLEDSESTITEILEDYNFDSLKAKNMLLKVLDKTQKQQSPHPEGIERRESEDKYKYIYSIFKSPESSALFDRAVAKLSTSNFEIMGTEQIVQSILEDEDSDLLKILANKGITATSFAEKLSEISSRQAEFEDKQIIFTPNALKTMLLAIETAKELGSAAIKPEHIVLGLLKSKSGIAYNIFKELNIDDSTLEEQIIKPIEKQMNETLVILRLAKQEARRMGKNIVGSELILLGIILEGSGIGANVLTDLGITLKDARIEIEKIIGLSDCYNEKEIQFSQRAKLILEKAWNNAKSANKTKISSEDLLKAISLYPQSLAMKALNNMGVDAIEIQQGLQIKEKDNVQ